MRIVCVTDGSSTQYPGDAVIRAQKVAEARAAASTLGVEDYIHLDLPDMRLDTVAHVEVNRVVEEQIRDSARRSSTPCIPTSNRDHRALFDSVAVATRPVPGQVVQRVLTYAPTSSTEWTPAGLNWFVPNWFVDVTATLDLKLASFAHYSTEARPSRIPGASRRSARRLRSTGRVAVARQRSRSRSCEGRASEHVWGVGRPALRT